MSESSQGQREMGRRTFLAAAGVGTAALCLQGTARAAGAPLDPATLVAAPPKGFSPLSAPGRVVKVAAKGDFPSMMQPNQLWPKAEVAKRLLERAMMDFTGAPNLNAAMARFISKDDIVAIKPNGIAGQKGATMATNFELIQAVVDAVLAVGVAPDRVMVYEQYPSFLSGCRVNLGTWKLPAGVRTGTHNNTDHAMAPVQIYQGISTRFCRFFTEATAIINLPLFKDHSICGFTGAMKNITHGNVDNPHAHHAHAASPQIAMLYNHPIVTSRVRLHIADCFKVMYDKGPLDKDPRTRVAHGALYVSTDPVAMDRVGWRVIEEERRVHKLRPLAEVLREPRYIHTAAELGLGLGEDAAISLRSAEI
jgi:uncharacterized protein (DUF362 family)